MKSAFTAVALTCLLLVPATAFSTVKQGSRQGVSLQAKNDEKVAGDNSRRQIIQRSVSALQFLSIATIPSVSLAVSGATDMSNKSAPDFLQSYEDFTKSDDGWQFKDVKIGAGDSSLEVGDRAVFDWSGYTIGYFGRPFEAKGGPQGGAFDKDVDYARTKIGSNTIVPGLEAALLTMKPGGIRQVIVPYGKLSYPPSDLEHKLVGPAPSSFSGQRALNFVLENPRVDRTLLFNVKLIRIDKSDGRGGYNRG